MMIFWWSKINGKKLDSKSEYVNNFIFIFDNFFFTFPKSWWSARSAPKFPKLDGYFGKFGRYHQNFTKFRQLDGNFNIFYRQSINLCQQYHNIKSHQFVLWRGRSAPKFPKLDGYFGKLAQNQIDFYQIARFNR